MSTFKKHLKSKTISEEVLDDNKYSNDSQNINDLPKTKFVKRQDSASEFKIPAKRQKKLEGGIDDCEEKLRQQIIDVMNRQLRKQAIDNLLRDSKEVIATFEADHDVLQENVQKLEQLTERFAKSMKQTTVAHKERLKAFKGVFATFKKECEEMDAKQRSEMEKYEDLLNEDIKKLKQEIISETKRSERENFKNFFVQAMQNNN